MQMSDESWLYIKGCNGVIGFPGGSKPVALTDNEVAGILRDLEEKSKKITQKHQFAVGDMVKITDGVFENMIGEVLNVQLDKGLISVMVNIFDRETRVDDLEFWQLEEVTDENNDI